MQRPCAYCKIVGHHIRDCEERKTTEERKRNYAQKPQSDQDWRTVRTVPIITPKYVAPPLPVKTAKNLYANLYSSSDDELEEGEIVEEDRNPRVKVFTPEPEPEPVQDYCWNRSGVKGVVINTPALSVSSDDDSGPECDYAALAEGMAKLSKYVERFKGCSWADIECDSDFE